MYLYLTNKSSYMHCQINLCKAYSLYSKSKCFRLFAVSELKDTWNKLINKQKLYCNIMK